MKKQKFRLISSPGRAKNKAKPVAPARIIEPEHSKTENIEIAPEIRHKPEIQYKPEQKQRPQERPPQQVERPPQQVERPSQQVERPQERPPQQTQRPLQQTQRPPQQRAQYNQRRRVAMPGAPKRRRTYGFLVFCLVFTLLVLAGIYVGATYLWDYLESYEISRPEHIIDQMSENINLDFWREAAENALTSRLTHFEPDAKKALEPHLSYILDVRYSIRFRPEESTDELLVYTVRAGASDIGIVSFTPMEEAGHGLFIWGVSSMEFLESFLDPFSRSITITASQNAMVEVNEIPVTGEFRIPCEYEYGVTYQIDNLYGEVSVAVIDSDGQRPEALFAQYNEFYFPIIQPISASFNFIVPYGAIVYADGERVSPDNIKETIVMTSIFKGIVDQSQVPGIAHARYIFGYEDIYEEPVITVTDSQGTQLESYENDDGDLIYKEEYSETLKAANAETAEDFMRAYVRFSSNVGGDPSSNLSALGNYMQRSSALYRHLQAAVATRTWNRISQVTFHEVTADKFKQYGDNYLSCEVYYNLTQRGHVDTVDVEMRHEVLFVRSNGRWLVVNVLAIE